MKSAPKREDYDDIRDFIRDWETYWDQTEPTGLAVLVRAAMVADDAAVAVDMQLGRSLQYRLSRRRRVSSLTSDPRLLGNTSSPSSMWRRP